MFKVFQPNDHRPSLGHRRKVVFDQFVGSGPQPADLSERAPRLPDIGLDIPETVSPEAVPFPRGIGHPIGIVPTPLVPTRDEIASVADQPDELRLGEGFSEHGGR